METQQRTAQSDDSHGHTAAEGLVRRQSRTYSGGYGESVGHFRIRAGANLGPGPYEISKCWEITQIRRIE